MTTVVPLSVEEALCALAEASDALRAAEAAQVIAIARVCELYRVNEEQLMAGAERLLQFGGAGTPLLGEFVLGEIGPILGVSLESARQRVAEVLDLRFRHPMLWDAVATGRVRPHHAALVTNATRQLDADAAAWVDRHAGIALTFQPLGRVLRDLPGWVTQADPALAAERAAERAAAREVRIGRIDEGHVDVWGRLDAADGLALDAALDHVALALAEAGLSGGRQVLRAGALGVLARHALGQQTLLSPDIVGAVTEVPGIGGGTSPRAGAPRPVPPRSATIVVHVDAATHGDVSVASEVVGWGPILTERLGDLLAGCAVTVRPVIDLNDSPAVDAPGVPRRMRAAITRRNPVCVFPFGVRRAQGCDLDHTIPYRRGGPPGQTNTENLGPLSRLPHRMKTHGRWQLRQPYPGVYEWRSPAGFTYTVTAAGTLQTWRPDWHALDHVDPDEIRFDDELDALAS